ncbi:hypothetical protein THAOC_00037, partial [Thalassiosira oceanica]
MGYAAGIGAFVAGRLGFAGSLGINALVENGKGWRLNLERKGRKEGSAGGRRIACLMRRVHCRYIDTVIMFQSSDLIEARVGGSGW